MQPAFSEILRQDLRVPGAELQARWAFPVVAEPVDLLELDGVPGVGGAASIPPGPLITPIWPGSPTSTTFAAA